MQGPQSPNARPRHTLCHRIYAREKSTKIQTRYFIERIPVQLFQIVQVSAHGISTNGALLSHAELLKQKQAEEVKDALYLVFLNHFTEHERLQTIEFWLGRRRVPAGGFRSLSPKPALAVLCGRKKKEKLPAAHVCFHRLDVPYYDQQNGEEEDVVREGDLLDGEVLGVMLEQDHDGNNIKTSSATAARFSDRKRTRISSMAEVIAQKLRLAISYTGTAISLV
ncbi:unnamed protein product [Amoebophrya sp. A120]|nr:unnamed protein product [Amoebophrya sp. A120]|eukprot:GSA120T00012018001.1